MRYMHVSTIEMETFTWDEMTVMYQNLGVFRISKMRCLVRIKQDICFLGTASYVSPFFIFDPWLPLVHVVFAMTKESVS